jgi:hypothetical protein
MWGAHEEMGWWMLLGMLWFFGFPSLARTMVTMWPNRHSKPQER